MKAILSVLLFIPMVLFSQEPMIEMSPEKHNKDEIHEVVDEPASFPGGSTEMMKYIGNTVKYPKKSIENKEEGRVFVEFVVNRDGSFSDIKILRGVSKDIDTEALRVVKGMPNWTPAELGGKTVRSRARLPLSFTL